MGTLVNETTGEHLELRGVHIFGRDASSDTCLPYPVISSLHAYLRWEGEYWVIIDVSRNGTFVDETRLKKGVGSIIKIGQRVRFGRNDCQLWRFIDDSKPTPMLIPVSTDATPIRFERNLFLVGNDLPELSIMQASEEEWILETLGKVQYFRDGDMLAIAGEEYLFRANKVAELTEVLETSLDKPNIHVVFHLSIDEEHTQIHINLEDEQFDLGEREHHYLLVTLARKRIADATVNIDPTAQGWIECEVLAAMLGIDVQHVNVHIFRIRQQMIKLAPSHNELVHIVERRRGGVRMAALPFTVYRGANIQGQYPL